MLRTMFLFEDRIPSGTAPIYLPRGNRAIYVRAGAVTATSDDAARYLGDDTAVIDGDELTLHSSDLDTVLWRWELASDDGGDETCHLLRSAPETSSELKLKATLDLDDRYTWLMRCDTVTFPPGGIAHTHLHQGPGIRITRSGEITIHTEGTSETYGPDSAWAEKGVVPVLAPTTTESPTVFVRCFLLPKHCRSASSIRFVHAEDRRKINTQSYRVLMERTIVA